MQNYIRIDDNYAVGKGPPDTETLAALQHEGFRAVVNLRTRGEENEPLDPDQEGDTVRAQGMEYVHLPVSAEEMDSERVDQFRDRIAELPKPVYVHCASGKRSGAFTMMHYAVEYALSGEDTLDQAQQMGFECDTPALENFVRDYVRQRGGR